MVTPSASSTLRHPRILCFHGGGSTGEIFRIQCRGLLAGFSQYFRCVFVDAPFISSPGPGIIPVFSGMGPYRRWIRPFNHEPEISDEQGIRELESQLLPAMDADDRQGATGEWVGLMGFSEGAKIAASILHDTQLKHDSALQDESGGVDGEEAIHQHVKGFAGVMWQFALLMAGRGPLVSLSDVGAGNKAMMKAGQLSDPKSWTGEGSEKMLKLPSIHVHGLQDWGLEDHRIFLHSSCDRRNATLVEWDGDHRIPIKPADVRKVVDATLKTTTELGVLGSQIGEDMIP